MQTEKQQIALNRHKNIKHNLLSLFVFALLLGFCHLKLSRLSYFTLHVYMYCILRSLKTIRSSTELGVGIWFLGNNRLRETDIRPPGHKPPRT